MVSFRAGIQQDLKKTQKGARLVYIIPSHTDSPHM